MNDGPRRDRPAGELLEAASRVPGCLGLLAAILFVTIAVVWYFVLRAVLDLLRAI